MSDPISTGLSALHQRFQTQVAKDIFHLADTRPEGLTPAEASTRFLHDGPNVAREHEQNWLTIFGRQFFTPLVGLLVIAGIISFFLGEETDGLTIAGILLINGLLGFIQEFRSSKSLQALSRFLRSTASVRRGGVITTVDRSQLVRGDIVIFKAGDLVPADVRLTLTHELSVDESTLTGESVDVNKISTPLSAPSQNLHEAINLLFAGSTVRRGEGEGVVIATGRASIIGSIAHLVSSTRHVSTFEENLKQFSSFLIKVVAVSLTIVFAVNVLTKGSSIDLPAQLLFALALAISVIPEALPAVTTITFSRGALKLAHQHVVVKRLSAIEDLGQIEILCTDKTGTLTENRPSVGSTIGSDRTAMFEMLLSGIPPTVRAGGREAGDPFDSALLEYARHEGLRIPEGDVIDEIPFDPARRRSSTVVREGSRYRLIVRGAPEAVVPLARTDGQGFDGSKLLEQSAALGASGERALAVAMKELPGSPSGPLEGLESGLTLLGLVSFVDPIKPSSRKALLEAERLGVEVKVVTGDSAAVAGSVGVKLGLIRSPLDVVTGEQLDRLSPAEYEQTARRVRIFARMTPIHKFQLIKTLEASASVGFLGEGMNDAPALKLATVSLVVDSAADVAREASDIVLLDKSLSVIIDGIREGRRIFANVLKYLKYTLVGNFGNFFAIAGISLITDYLPMLPIQILLTNILTDFPLVAVAGDTVDDKEVRRPQRFRLRELGFLTLTLGLVSTLFDFIFFGVFRTHQPGVIQTMWFVESILTELLLIYSIRTSLPIIRARTASAMLVWLTLGAMVTTVALPFTSYGQHVFHFIRPELKSMLLVTAIVTAYFAVTETVKQLYYRQYNSQPHRVAH